jgi:hypothetical protein
MSMIFPGMDPYLEDPQIWEGFQAGLIVYMRDAIQPQIRPRYIASVERRVVVEWPNGERRPIIPDVWVGRTRRRTGGAATAVAEPDSPIIVEVPGLEVHQSFLEILDTATGMRVVTVIEVVSPSNKYHGPGRDLYLTKQAEILRSPVHLVEIDLLRTGPHVLSVPEYVARAKGRYDYLVCTNRSGGARDKFELHLRRLPERLPHISIPLAGDDPDVSLDLQALVELTYDRGAYRDQLRYDRPCCPPLDPPDERWANELIENAMKATP